MTATVTPSTAPAQRGGLDFEALYRECRDDVYAYVHALLRDRTAAEDVCAQAFERAYRKQRTYRPSRGSARGWLYGIARNAALDELRKRKRTQGLVDPDPVDEHATDPLDAAETALRRTAVRTALAALAPRERELVALKFFSGLDNAEIAAVLGVSVSNAGTQLHRAMTKLREACHA